MQRTTLSTLSIEDNDSNLSVLSYDNTDASSIDDSTDIDISVVDDCSTRSSNLLVRNKCLCSNLSFCSAPGNSSTHWKTLFNNEYNNQTTINL
jgi:hypothetical protein